jgi:hypothetical protein
MCVQTPSCFVKESIVARAGYWRRNLSKGPAETNLGREKGSDLVSNSNKVIEPLSKPFKFDPHLV